MSKKIQLLMLIILPFITFTPVFAQTVEPDDQEPQTSLGEVSGTIMNKNLDSPVAESLDIMLLTTGFAMASPVTQEEDPPGDFLTSEQCSECHAEPLLSRPDVLMVAGATMGAVAATGLVVTGPLSPGEIKSIDRGVEQGLVPGEDVEAAPACVNVCPVGARVFGDIKNPESKLSQILETNDTFRLREDFGTQPKVHYVRPESEV